MPDGRSDESTRIKPRWAPRVAREKIRRLYEQAARGLVDDELVDEVGFGLYARCRSILTCRDLWRRRRLPCPACQSTILLGPDWSGTDPEYVVRCDRCAWTLRWGDYWATFRHQELGPGGAAELFEEFIRSWKAARSEREKILAIDRVIHRWHWENASKPPPFELGRPTGVNLIEGSRRDVITFLDGLTYGESTPPEVAAARDAWRERWGRIKERLARPPRGPIPGDRLRFDEASSPQ